MLAFAGCTDDAPTPQPAEEESDEGGGHQMSSLSFGDPDLAGLEASETFTGSFQFQDNGQYMGEVADEAGQDWTHQQSHDITGLVTAGAPYEIQVLADADAGAGDIDVWIEHDGVLATTWCDCPFGGQNEYHAYGTGEAGTLTLWIQFDEIHTEPTDTGPPVQGFDYTLDVTVRTDHRLIPPNVPLAVTLAQPGDHVMFANATSAIAVYGPDDTRLATLDDQTMYGLENTTAAGEYVFIVAPGGTPASARFGTTQTAATDPAARFLGVTGGFTVEEVPGDGTGIEFDAPASVVELGACGMAGDIETDAAFSLVAPDGSTYDSSTASGVMVGWGVCTGLDLGDEALVPGTWSAQYTGQVAQGAEVAYWVTSFER